jgi:hypothetical protein
MRCFYAPLPRRFLNRVRKFDSCRGHVRYKPLAENGSVRALVFGNPQRGYRRAIRDCEGRAIHADYSRAH